MNDAAIDALELDRHAVAADHADDDEEHRQQRHHDGRRPRTRGVTRYWTGLTANVASASICSVMRIEPSSVAMPAPARAATMIEVNTGASSRVSAMPERGADEALGAELPQRRGELQREDHADEGADHDHDHERAARR